MNDAVGYIFHDAIKSINKTLKTQKRSNRCFVIFAVCTTACVSVLRKQINEQNKTIRQLNDKITALEARRENHGL